MTGRRTSQREGHEVANIHPTAIIDPRTDIASDASIGPYTVIEQDVVIGSGCQIAGRVTLKARTSLGQNNVIHEGATLGGTPQHVHAGQQAGWLELGDGNTIRENVTIHCGLKADDITRVGDGNFIMVNAHIAHDCHIGDQTIICNNVMVAGHVTIHDRAYLSGAVGIHQFCRVGRLAMVGGQSHINRDIPPFVTVDGVSSTIVGLNRVGLKRNGFTSGDVKQLKEAYRIIYRSGLRWVDVLETLKEEFQEGPAAEFHSFLAASQRGCVPERRGPAKSTLKLFAGEQEKSEAKVRNAS